MHVHLLFWNVLFATVGAALCALAFAWIPVGMLKGEDRQYVDLQLPLNKSLFEEGHAAWEGGGHAFTLFDVITEPEPAI